MSTEAEVQSSETTRHDTPAGNARAWLVLLLAGAFEIGYAVSVGGSEGFTVVGWSVSAVVFFLLTLFALSVALKSIDVGIGYAVWAGIGSIGAAILGSILFDEQLTVLRAVWLAVIIGGVVWLKLADSPKLAESSTAEA
ncbi:multidrug efflux SMR transporter [Nocardia sp. NPDC005366]|uniref:DMT family transporter n=1 Tax=Nocardia sp. NPDC005366 TaxID=3156878 RepID=UPI0033AF70E6